MISVDWHLLLSILVASSYVVSLHLFKSEVLRARDRNDVLVIKHRFRNVSVLCITLSLVAPVLLHHFENSSRGPLSEYFRQLNIVKTSFTDFLNVLSCLGLITILYLGPVFEYVYVNFFDTNRYVEDADAAFRTIWGIRDHIFAPITEEIIYRSVILLILHDYCDHFKVFWSPLLFGVAHIHHAYDLIVYKKLDKTMVLLNGLFQTLYTWIFGMVATHLFLKYQNIWCCIVVHAVCNWIGFPSLATEAPMAVYFGLIASGVYFFCKLL